MRCTIKDVAKLANTSPATVSLVLNNKPGVNVDTKKRVLDAVEKLNYHPNQIARNLINQKANAIGLIVSDILNPFYGELVYNMQKETEKREINLIIGISNNKVSNEKRIVESMIRRGVDGLILVPARDGEGDLRHVYELQRVGIPFVFITSRYQGIQADTVMTDLERATYELTDYLIKSGERDLVFVVENRSLLHVEYRIAGFSSALRNHGLNMNEDCIIEINPDIENAVWITRNKIMEKKPDAVIAINAFTAMGIMKGLLECDVKIPDEISVTCFDDLEFASILYTPLTAIKQPLEQMCMEALDILDKRIQGNNSPFIQKLLPGELIVRESTKRI